MQISVERNREWGGVEVGSLVEAVSGTIVLVSHVHVTQFSGTVLWTPEESDYYIGEVTSDLRKAAFHRFKGTLTLKQ